MQYSQDRLTGKELGMYVGILVGIVILQATGEILGLVVCPIVGFVLGMLVDRIAGQSNLRQEWSEDE